MKRLCLILAYLFLFSQTASAMPLLIGQKVVYRGTVTGLRISAVDGTAFIDNAGATIPTYADGNHQIEIYDASNRMLRGVLKEVGTSEGLGDETVSGFTNVSYDVFTTDGANITNAEQTTAGTKICFQNYSYQSLALYKSVVSLTLVSGLAPKFGIGRANTLDGAAGNSKPLSNGVNTNYHTPIPIPSGACGFYNTLNSKWNTSGVSLKQVLTPSTLGATIVSAKGGDVYNFSYKNASFTYNAASYYVIIRAIR